jgi:signal transduction histidine kinase
MHSIARGSSRLAYLFISINLVLLLAFLVYASMTIRDVDASRDRYEGVIRNWHELRLAVSERGRPMTPPAEYVTFSGDMEALLSSELIRVAGRLSDPLAASEAQLSSAWDRLQLVFEREVFASTQASSSAAPSFDYSASVFEEALFGLEDVLTEFVALQQRALSILLYFLGGTILATTLVFVLVERENERERRAARQVRSLAWTTIRTQEQERARISRGLHDSLAQELSTTLLELD